MPVWRNPCPRKCPGYTFSGRGLEFDDPAPLEAARTYDPDMPEEKTAGRLEQVAISIVPPDAGRATQG